MSERTGNGAATAAAGDREGSVPEWRVRLATLLVRMLAATWRLDVHNGEVVDELRRQGAPIVFCLWHGTMLPLLWHHRHQGICILISSHSDGELIAQIAARLGCRAVRGSTSRGGGRALLGLVRELSRGREVAVTPDGPRGPAERFAPGALLAAQRTGSAVVAMGVAADRAWRLRSWDRFLVPKPRARVRIAYSQPTLVGATTVEGIMAEVPRFERLMLETSAAAGRPSARAR